MAPNKPSQRSDEEGVREEGKSPDQALGEIIRGEEHDGDYYRQVAIGTVIKPLNKVSNKACHNDFAAFFWTNARWVGALLARKGWTKLLLRSQRTRVRHVSPP